MIVLCSAGSRKETKGFSTRETWRLLSWQWHSLFTMYGERCEKKGAKMSLNVENLYSNNPFGKHICSEVRDLLSLHN